MKRGQEYTDYINASFIDVRIRNFHVFKLQVRYFAVADKSFRRDTLNLVYEEHELFCLGFACEFPNAFHIWCFQFRFKWLGNLNILLAVRLINKGFY